MSNPPRFSVGDRVIDRDADDPSAMIVLDPDRGIAADVAIDDRDETVADLNPEYPSTGRVVRCIHEEWLERHAGSVWRSWPRESFPERLAAFTREWRLSPRTYDYPEGRLEPLAGDEEETPHPPRMRDPPKAGQTSMEQWLR